jgi:glutathione synthase/RimK-type ligase-like ATP-grasp enzyme
MKKIILLTDYRGFFESKYTAKPYNSGMNKLLLEKYFNENNFEIQFLSFSEIDFRKKELNNSVILYTSSEDTGLYYKSFIEDIILGLTLSGVRVIPEFKFLRANSNKVFMEILRDQVHCDNLKNIRSAHFGCIEELLNTSNILPEISVMKPAAGAMSRGVGLAKSKSELIQTSKIISRSRNLFREYWEIGRSVKYSKYTKESRHRMKFIVQNFIPGLSNDWKILIYGNKYYALYRKNRANDFRASGGGLLSYKEELPGGMLDFSKMVYDEFKVPNLSIDVAYDGKQFYLIEFQTLYFGTYTLEFSPFYFIQERGQWVRKIEKSILEQVYAESVSGFINEKLKVK